MSENLQMLQQKTEDAALEGPLGDPWDAPPGLSPWFVGYQAKEEPESLHISPQGLRGDH